MSFKDLLDKGRGLYDSGIPALDNEVTDGFPCNSFGVIRGPGGGGKSALLNDMAKSMMESGKRVIYVCYEDTPLSVLQNLCSLGWDYKTMLDKDFIHLVDCFSTRALRKSSPSPQASQVRDPTNPDEIRDAIHDFVEIEHEAELGCVFMDSITELFLQTHPFKAVNAVKAWRATFCKELVIPFWATYHTGLQQFQAYDDMIAYTTDAIIDTRHEPVFKKAGVLIKQFRVTKIKGAGHNTQWISFKVGNMGVEVMTLREIKALAKKITKYESGD